ncbi:MAG: recombination-associated protein RdgC [Betaproteobacteria bacterium]|nr:recombination-associated protein RdgC [Betaproteobacteria bacterium]
MWFKNVQLFRFVAPDSFPAALEDSLRAHPYRSCASMDMRSLGWVSPLGPDAEALAHGVGTCVMVSACVEEKLLPAAVVRQAAAEKIASIEAEQAHKLGAKRRREIKDQVVDELLPRAFSRLRTTYAYWDLPNGWLIVDAATPKKADELAELLIKSVEGLHLRPVRPQESPSSVMTQWLREGDAAGGFTIDTDCELVAPTDEGATARFSRHNLDSNEIRAHIEAGKCATRLALTWDDRISFVLTEDFQLKRLAFLDVVQEASERQGAEGAAEQFDADFALMSAEFARLLPALLAAMGGEAQPV